MTLQEELDTIQYEMPKAWEYIHEMIYRARLEGARDIAFPTLPDFDENGDIIPHK